MFCTQCGQQVGDHDNFCTRCGTRISASLCVVPTAPKTPRGVKEPKLTYAEKERMAVQRTTLQDMQRYTNTPYMWNGRLEKFMQPNGHPFAYMDINSTNRRIALSELEAMNVRIEYSKTLCKKIPKSLQIPLDKITFQRSSDSGYSRLICSPVTHLGELSERPFSLTFMTDLSKSDTTHGDLYYDQAGKINAADIYFWRRGNGFFFYFETVNGVLVLSKVESTTAGCDKTAMYKAPHILELEAKRKAEEGDFAWIQSNLPDKCPKNITGFRRMKTQNTKNYQLLKQLAAEKGRSI